MLFATPLNEKGLLSFFLSSNILEGLETVLTIEYKKKT